jgi:hypothetical protein
MRGRLMTCTKGEKPGFPFQEPQNPGRAEASLNWMIPS